MRCFNLLRCFMSPRPGFLSSYLFPGGPLLTQLHPRLPYIALTGSEFPLAYGSQSAR